MGDKVYFLAIKVDLDCCRCRQGIQDHLCKIQHKERIVAIFYDEKKNVVQVSGPFNPEQLKRKLLCKLPKIIKCIDIVKAEQVEKPPKKDVNKEKFMRCCEEEYEEITKSLEKCKKECEEKCKKEFEEKLKRKCKCKCSCDCKEPPKDPPKKPPCKEPPQQPPPPTCLWPPQVKMVCCPNPCPCFVQWSNNYRCCSCGVVSWPGGCQPGWGSGHGSCSRPQWGCEPNRTPGRQWGCEPSRTPGCPQWGCEPSPATNIVLESSPPCTIM